MWQEKGQILTGNAIDILKQLPEESVNCCVTSPPYWALRDYGVKEQIGLEETPGAYIVSLCAIFEQVRRIMRPDGTLWLNLGDTYIGYHGNRNAENGISPSDRRNFYENMRPSSVGINNLKNKDLVGIPWRVAFALQEMGWYLRTEIIWHKPNPMPESVKDRPTRAHEYIFLFSKEPRYYYDYVAVRERVAAYSNDKWQSDKSLNFVQEVNEPERPNQKYSQHRAERAERVRNSTPVHKPNRKNPEMAQKSGSMGTPNPGWRNCRSVWTAPECVCCEEKITKKRTVRQGVDIKGGAQGNGEISFYNGFRNRHSVWQIPTRPYKEAHFATFPPDLVRPCILAGCAENGVVLDPFFGSGTVGQVCLEENRRFIGIEINPEYVQMAERRLGNVKTHISE